MKSQFNKFSKKPAAARTQESQIIGYFYVNQTKSGKPSIRVAFPDGTTMFLNFSKDADDKGVVVLGNGGKGFELINAEVAVDVKVKAKAATSKKATAEEEDLF